MRIKTLLLLTSLLLLSLLPNNCWATNWCEDSDVVACFTIEAGSGGTLDDKSSNSEDGSFSDPTWSGTVPDSGDGFDGTSNYSLYFDGSDNPVNIGSSTTVDDISPFTYVGWISVSSGGDSKAAFFSKALSNTFRDDSSGIRCMFPSKGGPDVSSDYASGDVDYNSFKHYACTWDGTIDADNAYVYADGVDVTSSRSDGSGITSDASNDLVLGSRTTGVFDPLTGYMDEVAFFETQLSSTDINDIMDNGLVQATATARRFFLIQ